jgi:hypothetical protein
MNQGNNKVAIVTRASHDIGAAAAADGLVRKIEGSECLNAVTKWPLDSLYARHHIGRVRIARALDCSASAKSSSDAFSAPCSWANSLNDVAITRV